MFAFARRRQESAAFGSHPELLAVLPYAESLEDNEAMSASGLCTYSIIHDLKNKAGVEPPATNSARDGRCADPTPPLTVRGGHLVGPRPPMFAHATRLPTRMLVESRPLAP